MHFNRTSSAASLLVVLACGLVVMPAGDRGKASDGLPLPVAPAKSVRRLVLKDEEGAVAWIHSIARRAIADAEFKIEGRSLEKAVSLLKLDEVLRLLGNPDYWPEESVYEQWWRLLPLRRMLLERVAVLDVRRGLGEFPHEARLLLEVAARQDGAAALEAWLACKEEWRKRPGRISVDSDASLQWIEGVGEMPETSITDGYETAEASVLARLMKGWASSAPDNAWAAFRSMESLSYSDSEAVRGLISGLADGSDWGRWASRIESFEWSTPGQDELDFSPGPESKSTAALASRWVVEDAGAALEWYRAQEATWEESQTYFHLSAFNFAELGNNHGPVVPMLAPVYEAWLEKRPGLALAYLENSIGAQREPFQYLVRWTELPDETKIGVLAIMPGGEKKDDAAVSLAGKVRWTKSADHETRVARLDEIARIQGLGAGTLAEIEAIKEKLEADATTGSKGLLEE